MNVFMGGHIGVENLFLFFFNDTATTEIYTLSLHDALPISAAPEPMVRDAKASLNFLRVMVWSASNCRIVVSTRDRKSTRLNSSHVRISYAVFCLKKKNSRGAPRSRANAPRAAYLACMSAAS